MIILLDREGALEPKEYYEKNIQIFIENKMAVSVMKKIIFAVNNLGVLFLALSQYFFVHFEMLSFIKNSFFALRQKREERDPRPPPLTAANFLRLPN